LADVGLLLLDLSLRPIAFDRGAASILNSTRPVGVNPDTFVPREIVNVLRNRKPTDLASESTSFHIGRSEYSFRAFLLETGGALTRPILALHLEKVSSASDAVYEIAAKYNLTDREREVLRGIALGLANNDVAERLGISPSTVKSFQRLIMLKMGAKTRAGMIAKLLQSEPSAPAIHERLAG